METASLSDGPIDPELLLLLRQVQKTKAGSNSNTGILIDEDDPEEVDNTDAWSDEIFVEEIRNYRCLWDTSCRAYKDGSATKWKSLVRLRSNDRVDRATRFAEVETRLKNPVYN